MVPAFLFIGLGVAVGVLAAAVDAAWLVIIGLLLAVVGGIFFFGDMQKS